MKNVTQARDTSVESICDSLGRSYGMAFFFTISMTLPERLCGYRLGLYLMSWFSESAVVWPCFLVLSFIRLTLCVCTRVRALVCVCVCAPEYVYMCHMSADGMGGGSAEYARCPGTEARDGCEMPCGYEEPNLELLQEQQDFLTSGPSLQFWWFSLIL